MLVLCSRQWVHKCSLQIPSAFLCLKMFTIKCCGGGGNISSKISAQRPVFGDTGRTLLCCDQQEVVSTWNARVFLESRCHARHHGLDDAGRAASF